MSDEYSKLSEEQSWGLLFDAYTEVHDNFDSWCENMEDLCDSFYIVDIKTDEIGHCCDSLCDLEDYMKEYDLCYSDVKICNLASFSRDEYFEKFCELAGDQEVDISFSVQKFNAEKERDTLLANHFNKTTSSEIAGDNELHTALRSGDIAEAIRLISEVDGKLIQQVNDEGKRPFEVADVKSIGNEKDTALHLAAMWGDTEDVLSLIERGADLKAVNDEGCTPLQAAKLYDNNSDVSDVIRANMPRERSRM